MPIAFRLAPLSAEQHAVVLAAFNQTRDAETRLRYQMVLLAHQGMSAPEIARLTLRQSRTVVRPLQRFVRGGIAAVPYRRAPGVAPTVTTAWRAELIRVIELSPRAVGVPSATWTTQFLASYLSRATGVAVSLETVRRELHAAGYVCKRPIWTLKRKTEEQPEYAGNARVEALLAVASPEPPPIADVLADLVTLIDLPADLPALLGRLATADLYLQDEIDIALHRR